MDEGVAESVSIEINVKKDGCEERPVPSAVEGPQPEALIDQGAQRFSTVPGVIVGWRTGCICVQSMDVVHGTGDLKCGPRDLGSIPYQVEVGVGGQARIVKFDRPFIAKDGDRLHLTLEDGRMLDCQMIDASSYCSVVGEGPYYDRRADPR